MLVIAMKYPGFNLESNPLDMEHGTSSTDLPTHLITPCMQQNEADQKRRIQEDKQRREREEAERYDAMMHKEQEDLVKKTEARKQSPELQNWYKGHQRYSFAREIKSARPLIYG
jgi:hypothetical protein